MYKSSNTEHENLLWQHPHRQITPPPLQKNKKKVFKEKCASQKGGFKRHAEWSFEKKTTPSIFYCHYKNMWVGRTWAEEQLVSWAGKCPSSAAAWGQRGWCGQPWGRDVSAEQWLPAPGDTTPPAPVQQPPDLPDLQGEWREGGEGGVERTSVFKTGDKTALAPFPLPPDLQEELGGGGERLSHCSHTAPQTPALQLPDLQEQWGKRGEGIGGGVSSVSSHFSLSSPPFPSSSIFCLFFYTIYFMYHIPYVTPFGTSVSCPLPTAGI